MQWISDSVDGTKWKTIIAHSTNTFIIAANWPYKDVSLYRMYLLPQEFFYFDSDCAKTLKKKKISHDLATQTRMGDWGGGVIISSNPFLHLMHSDLVPSWVRALKSQQAGLVAEKMKVIVERRVFTAQLAVFAATQTSCPIFSGRGIFNEAIKRITVLLPSPSMENSFNLS